MSRAENPEPPIQQAQHTVVSVRLFQSFISSVNQL
jgi:hypothetical protein